MFSMKASSSRLGDSARGGESSEPGALKSGGDNGGSVM